MKVKLYKILNVSFLLLICFACAEEETDLNNSDLIFPNSYQLKVFPYSYSDSLGNIYHVQGDTIFYTAVPDTLNNQPELRWDSIGFGPVTVAIFTMPVQVTGPEIKNVENIIWQWHNGMESEKKGIAKYLEGKYVNNGIIDYNNNPPELEQGNYYWAIWGWNNDGIKILYSSREMHFYVKE